MNRPLQTVGIGVVMWKASGGNIFTATLLIALVCPLTPLGAHWGKACETSVKLKRD